MSEPTETVVVDDANAAHALIGRSIGGQAVAFFTASDIEVRFFTLGQDDITGYRRWGTPVEVDAAPEVVSGWPEATVELVTTAISQTRGVLDIDTDGIPDNQWRTLARAALKVLPDPTADTVLLDQIRAIAAEWDDRGATWCMKRIAALFRHHAEAQP